MAHVSFLWLLATFAAAATASRLAERAPEPILQERSFLCPVVCDDTWCCLTGQRCQETNDGDVPYECDDPLLETTDSAFALGVLSSQVESILTENSAFISSLTEEFSLTLTFSEITTLPEPAEETVPPSPRETTTTVPVTTEEPETSTTEAPEIMSTTTDVLEETTLNPTQEDSTTEEVESMTIVLSSTEGAQTETPSTTTVPTTTIAETFDTETATSEASTSEPDITSTTASEDGAATSLPPWHHVIAAGMAAAFAL